MFTRRFRPPRIPDLEPALAALGASAVVASLGLALSAEARAAVGGWLVEAGGPAGAERARVVEVLDGDTVVLADGRSVRLLGIDTPETRNPAMAGAQPFGAEATERLRGLVDGRDVRLEKDVSETDHYGRLLRHVWVGGTLVAERLAGEGLGYASVFPPDTRHGARVRAAEAEAKAVGRGLWGLPRPTALPVFAGAGR